MKQNVVSSVLSRERAALLLARMRAVRIVVVGDLVADLYLRGETSRISREAPVLILRYEGEEYRPGGAANAVANAAALSRRTQAVGVVGTDVAGRELLRLFRRAGADVSGVVAAGSRPTSTKMRILAGGRHTSRQQVIRVDREDPSPLAGAVEAAVVRAVGRACRRADAILVSDYSLGVLTPRVRRRIAKALNRTIGAVDARRGIERYRGFSLVKLNEDEVEATGAPATEAGRSALRRRLGTAHLLVTRGAEGMSLFSSGSARAWHLAVHGTSEATDVTGAGDTVAVVATLALAAGASGRESAALADVAAGIVVAKHGAATAGSVEILRALGG